MRKWLNNKFFWREDASQWEQCDVPGQDNTKFHQITEMKV